ncbi:protein of unknown function [Magnetospira sp. QH-2]|nr:protein of unknown function [Magnetospira sp. QH-2]
MNRVAAVQRLQIFRPLYRLLMGVMGLVFAMLVAEYGIRLAHPEIDPNVQIQFIEGRGDQPTLGAPGSEKRQIKNTGDFDVMVRFNQHGLRDSKDVSKATDSDWVVVGDSYFFGWGVEEQDRLSEQLDLLIEPAVFNLAMPTGLPDYGMLIGYARRLGAPADRVIMGLTMEDDVALYEQNPTDSEVESGPPSQVQPNGANLFLRLKAKLLQNSALYFMATSIVHHHEMIRDMAIAAGLIRPNLQGVHQHEFSQAAIDQTVAEIVKISMKARDFLVVVLPSRALWVGDHQADEARRHATIIQGLRDQGLMVVDLKPHFENGQPPMELFFTNDGHWRPSGHARAAQAIEATLRKMESAQ